MKKIYFGSGDSLDIDVAYIFDEMPNLQECKSFCSDKIENRNIICIEDGIVSKSYKGTIDEMNNVIYNTFSLHKQILENNPILKSVERDIPLKCIRTIRGLLSVVSRTKYRENVKKALKSTNWNFKLDVLSEIDLNLIEDYVKDSKTESLKFIAFQLGQTLSLINNIETYTKSDIAINYPILSDFLYRKNVTVEQINNFNNFYHDFLSILKSFDVEQIVYNDDEIVLFKKYLNIYDLKNEVKIN